MKNEFFEKLLHRFAKAERFLLSTHRNPDPDGLGAEIALDSFLRHRGYDSVIFNQDPIQARYGFLDPEGRALHAGSRVDRDDLEGRLVVMVDNSDIGRSGEAARFIDPDGSNLVIIDHHDGIEPDLQTYFLAPEIGSTSEMIYELLVYTETPIEPAIARALYAGIVIDTGHFRYRKTTDRTHRIASHLLELGVDPADMAERLLASWNRGRLAGRKRLYESMQVDAEQQLAWFAIRHSELDDLDAQPDDLDGIVNELIEVRGIQAGLLFTERAGGITRVSARSKGDTDLLPAVAPYGGGGHKNACGATIPLDLDAAVEEFIPIAAACVVKSDA